MTTYEELIKAYTEEKARSQEKRHQVAENTLEELSQSPRGEVAVSDLILKLREIVEEPDSLILSVLWQMVAGGQIDITADRKVTRTERFLVPLDTR